LGVTYILEGSFTKHEDDVKLIVQLIITKSGEEEHVWANEYNKKWDEIFSLQSEVAQTIAKELNAAITPDEKSLINKVPTPDLTAYDLTLQAQKFYYDYFLSADRGKAELEKVKQLSKTALELDPGFAQAYYWLGNSSLSDQYVYGFPLPFFLDTALYFFNKALKLDPTLAEAYAERGRYYLEKAQTKKAVDDLNKSISLSPNNSRAYYLLGASYSIDRDFVNALINYRKADELTKSDATQLSILDMIFWTYASAGDFQKQELYRQKLEQFDPQRALSRKCSMLEAEGKYEELLTEAEKYIIQYPEIADGYDVKARALLGIGRIKESEDCIRLRLKYSGPELNNAHRVGIVLWMNGKRDEAYKWLREYEKLGFMVGTHESIKADPLFNNLRNDDEFKEIIKRANEKADEIRARINELEEQGVL
jgi:hypothetical protein